MKAIRAPSVADRPGRRFRWLHGSGAQSTAWQRAHQYSGLVCCSMVNGGGFDIDLLHDCEVVRCGATAATARTGIERMRAKASDLFGRERFAFVHVVAGLAADGTLLGRRESPAASA